LTNVTLAQAGNYSAAISNPAGNAPLSSNAVLTVLADFDRDRMADVWEAAYGLSTNTVADASLDADGDTMSNLAEFVAGTDPTNAASYLKLDALVPDAPAQVTFEAVSNRTYTVEYTDTLAVAPWVKLADVAARATNRVETVSDPSPNPRRFYRLVTPAIP
jgi:hypothetical protein